MNLYLTTTETHWSLGTLIGLPVGVLLTVLLAVSALYFYRVYRRIEEFEAQLVSGFAAVAAVVAFGLTAWGMFPYTYEHHQWRSASGTVTSVEKRITGGSSDIEEKFVVTFDGSDQQYGCSDTRCATIQAGDRLSLSCKKQWEYAATDGWDCRFIDYEKG